MNTDKSNGKDLDAEDAEFIENNYFVRVLLTAEC